MKTTVLLGAILIPTTKQKNISKVMCVILSSFLKESEDW